MRPMRTPRVAFVALLFLPAWALGAAGAQTEAALPQGHWNSVAWIDGDAYMLGGYDWHRPDGPGRAMREILRYDPRTGDSTVMGATLPTGRWYTAVASDGRYAYAFGGNAWSDYTDEILRYDPASDTLVVLPTRLPGKMQAADAAFDGTSIYVFGGDSSDGRILRFDPATGALDVMAARLPNAFSWEPRVVWDGARFVIFNEGQTTTYDPATDALEPLPRTMADAYAAPLLVRGRDAILLGGGPFGDATRIDLDTGHVAYLGASVPHFWGARHDAWWTEDGVAYVVQGCMGGCNTIQRATLTEPAAPPTLVLREADAMRYEDEEGARTVYWLLADVAGSPLYRRTLDVSLTPRALPLDAILGAPTSWRTDQHDWHAVEPREGAWLSFTVWDDAPTRGVCLRVTAEPARSDWEPAVSNAVCIPADSFLPDAPPLA